MYIRLGFCLMVIYHLTSLEGAPLELTQPNQDWLQEMVMSPSLELSRKFEMGAFITTPLANEDTDMEDYVEIVDQIPFQTNLYKSPRNSKVSNVIALSKNKPLNDKKFSSEMSLNVESTIKRLKNQLDLEKQKVEKLSYQLNQVKNAAVVAQENDFNSRPLDFVPNTIYRRVNNKPKLVKSIPKGERPSLNGIKKKYKDDDKYSFYTQKNDSLRLNKSNSYLTEGYFDNQHSNTDMNQFQNTDNRYFRKEDIMNKFYPLLFNDESLKAKGKLKITDDHRKSQAVLRERPEDIYMSHMKKLTAPYDVFPMKTNPKTRYLNIKNRKRGAETLGNNTTSDVKSVDGVRGGKPVDGESKNEVTNRKVVPLSGSPINNTDMKPLNTDEKAKTGIIENEEINSHQVFSFKISPKIRYLSPNAKKNVEVKTKEVTTSSNTDNKQSRVVPNAKIGEKMDMKKQKERVNNQERMDANVDNTSRDVIISTEKSSK